MKELAPLLIFFVVTVFIWLAELFNDEDDETL